METIGRGSVMSLVLGFPMLFQFVYSSFMCFLLSNIMNMQTVNPKGTSFLMMRN